MRVPITMNFDQRRPIGSVEISDTGAIALLQTGVAKLECVGEIIKEHIEDGRRVVDEFVLREVSVVMTRASNKV